MTSIFLGFSRLLLYLTPVYCAGYAFYLYFEYDFIIK